MTLKRCILFAAILLLCCSLPLALYSEEGMIPLSEISKLDLKVLGFQLDSKELYNPAGVSVIDGIINLSGCTASFVSPEGLILTNYHCAFRAIQSVTTQDKDYMLTGFTAMERATELPAKGYTVRLIESYQDVSQDILKAIKKKMTYAERTKAIEKTIKDMVVLTEKKLPGRRAEVAEMFQGKTYILFIYTYLKDIRLVYAPPRSIGEYGGELDNWMWPRHTGDFTFMRAYVAPDGSSAEYSEKNIPFHPKKYLQVAPEGVKEEDFVFILGYPGSTFRHRSSYFYAFEEEIRKPYVVELFSWNIHVLEELSKKDRDTEIKLAPQLKGLWNTMKSYKGQLKALKALKLTEKKQQEEKEMLAFINADPKRQQKYGTVLERLKELYSEKRKDANYDLLLQFFNRSSAMLANAYTVYEASIELKKKDTDRESEYMERNFDRTKQFMTLGLRNYVPAADKIILKAVLMRAATMPVPYRVPAVEELILARKEGVEVEVEKAVDSFIEKAYSTSKLYENDYLIGLFSKSTLELQQIDDPFLRLAAALYPTFQNKKNKEEQQKGILDELSAQLIDVKKEFKGTHFIPDANSTLRLTYGHIRGYSPADAVYYKPFTTLSGVVEKNTGLPPYIAPERLLNLSKNKEYGMFMHPGLKDVPVNILFNMDTTGGNSGSPVLNAWGQLIGLNFDRVYEATINDFGWDEKYSRSIGVDIRYILWFLDKFAGAGHLITEMNIK